MTETPGTRLYQIRLACGDGQRKAEPLDAFAKRVKRVTKSDYDPSSISLLERMKQGWKLDDVERFASVDPLKRGRVWLAGWSDEAVGDVEAPDPGLRHRQQPGGRKHA